MLHVPWQSNISGSYPDGEMLYSGNFEGNTSGLIQVMPVGMQLPTYDMQLVVQRWRIICRWVILPRYGVRVLFQTEILPPSHPFKVLFSV